jgi:hypothetical protein
VSNQTKNGSKKWVGMIKIFNGGVSNALKNIGII